MKKAIVLALALGLVVVFSSAALADFGECRYGSHAKRTVADKLDTSKTVASKDTIKLAGDKLARVQKDNLNQPASPKK